MQGIVHLAAVSRVIWGERDPEYCWSVNVQAMRSLLHLCMNLPARPWLIFASSREVYGNATTIPVSEDAEFKPLNTYARSKSEGERLVQAATRDGLLANICRLSSVYGCPWDYRDRVVMAFARTAASGGTMRLEGATNTFDFTQVGDVVEGLWHVVEATMARERLPPIHFVTGEGTSLLQLAKIAERNALKPVKLEEAPSRDFDVTYFVGDPTRAWNLLGWKAGTSPTVGVSNLITAISEVAEVSADDV